MIIGGISGYFAGATDTVIMRLCELIMSIPALYLIISLRATFPPDMSSSQIYAMIVIILSFIGWAGMARVIRGMTLSLREQQFILAARALGQSHLKIIVRHILPNTFSYVIVAATLSVPYYILGEVVLSFLGVGIQEPQASWGNMLTAARKRSNICEIIRGCSRRARRFSSPFSLSTSSAMACETRRTRSRHESARNQKSEDGLRQKRRSVARD